MATCGRCGYDGPFNHGCGPASPSVNLLTRLAELEDENARLRDRVEEAEAFTKEVQEYRDFWLAKYDEATIKHDDALGRSEHDLAHYKALAERRKKALERYGKHENLCRYGLLPSGVGRHSYSAHEDERMEAAAIKECTCGFRAAIEEGQFEGVVD